MMTGAVDDGQLALRQLKRVCILSVEGGDIHQLDVQFADGCHHGLGLRLELESL